MKKNLIIALSAVVAAFTFVGCDKPQTTEEVSIVLNPTELLLSVGESQKVNAVVKPDGTAITWSTDAEDVATVNNGIVTAVASGTAIITATAGEVKATCTVTVSNDASLKNFTIADYGLFGDVEYIPNTKGYVQLTNGDSLLCQAGYITFMCWSDGLVFTNGSGFSGNGIIFAADMPIYWVVEGEDAGKYIGSAGGFRVDTLNGKLKPYTAEAGELVDLQKYGDYFTQLIAYRKDTNNKLDNNLYYDSQIGTQLYSYNADKKSQTYNYGNVKKAQFKKDRDEQGNMLPLQYTAVIEWYDFVNDGRFLGLKANFDEEGNLESIVKPYDMNTITMEYTNIVSEEGGEAYFIGDQSHLHLGEMPVINRGMDNTIMYRK